MVKTKTDSAMVTINAAAYLALQEEQQELHALIDEFFEDGISENDLHLIRLPTGGGQQWQMPDDSMVDAFEAVIIAVQNTRLYWADAFTGGGMPPDCSSRDGKMGVGTPGGYCSACEFSQWGSGKNNFGTACQQRQVVYILLPGETLPARLGLSVTSFTALRRYKINLLTKRLPLWGVVTRVSLERTKNKQGIVYSVAKFSQAGPLPEDMTARAKAYAAMIKSVLQLTPEPAEPTPLDPATTKEEDVPWGSALDDDVHA